MDLGIEGQAIMITGGASGIGLETARLFASEGADVALVDMSEDGLNAALDELAEYSVRCMSFKADVTSPDEVSEAVKTISGEFERIDSLLNSAGVYREVPVDELSLEEWEQVMAVNLSGTFLCSQAVAEVMKECDGGSIVNMGSLAGQVGGLVAGADYSVSKAGVICFTKSLAKKVGSFGIRVNTISPGPTESPMTANWPPGRKEEIASETPLGRIAGTDDIAKVVLFLCSRLAKFITGARIDVNGGLFMD